jgi:phospholipase C
MMATRLTRRGLLRYGGALGAALALGDSLAGVAAAAAVRPPDSLPDPTRPAGTADEALPFEHIVVVMMENHSFDNLLGALTYDVPPTQPHADGLTFSAAGVALNSNPGPSAPVQAFPFPSTAQGPNVSQTWNATHQQIDGGKMDAS